ncbi:hypothetical protein AB0F03_27375 [Streptomyces sp. NPDC028722]|uniref:hypothetical protein n=1 Tax=Streptomyces sp. NPDC028722 TaxID=3155016 RepID=UPI0033C6CBA4
MSTAPRRPDEPIVLVRVPPQEVCRPATTVIVRWNALGPCPAEALQPGGTRLGAARIDGGELFPDAIAGPALRGLVGTEAAPGLVPLCYLAEHPGGGYHAYAQIRFHPEDARFVRTTREPVGHGPAEELRWFDPVLTAHAESSTALNNHLRYFRKHFSLLPADQAPGDLDHRFVAAVPGGTDFAISADLRSRSGQPIAPESRLFAAYPGCHE